MFEDDLNLLLNLCYACSLTFLLFSIFFLQAPIDKRAAFLQMTAKANKLKTRLSSGKKIVFQPKTKRLIFFRWHHFLSLVYL